jgi:hypothetical protein
LERKASRVRGNLAKRVRASPSVFSLAKVVLRRRYIARAALRRGSAAACFPWDWYRPARLFRLVARSG